MSNKEEKTSAFNPFAQMLLNAQKVGNEALSNTQSSVSKAPQGAKIVGNYLLGKNIGVGAFGKVYLAMHLPTSEKVAIKVIDKLKMNACDIKRAKCQIQVLKAVSHRHIVNLYQIIQTEKSLLLVTQYLPAGQLFSLIIKQKKIGQVEACVYFQQIIAAVEYLHRNKIAHRDLKPENILIDFDNQLKVIDFGLSSFYQKNELKTFCGSPCYAAPEMIAAKKHYNPLYADLWSCGIILFSMLCGHLPFCDTDTKTLYKKILNCTYSIPSHVSPAAKSLIEGLLVLTPNKRMSLKQIQKHKWFNMIVPRSAFGIDIGEHLSLDPSLLSRLSTMGVKEQSVRNGIFKNQKDKDTATYYILMKKVVKSGELVPTYIGNDNFNPKLIMKVDKKAVQDDTESFNSPENPVVVIECPEAPEPIPQPIDTLEPGSQLWCEEHNYTSEQIREIDHSELTLFATNILDIVISKYVVTPEFSKLNQILFPEEENNKNIAQAGSAQIHSDKFYAFNKMQAKKIIDLQSVTKDLDLNKDENPNKFTLEPLPTIIKITQKRTNSLINSQRLLLLRNLSKKRIKATEGDVSKKQIELPKISKKINSKLEPKVRELMRRYNLLSCFVKAKAPSIN